MDDKRWNRVTELFEQLLSGIDASVALAGEPNPEVREAVMNLWRHHIRAEEEGYLANPVGFTVATVFQPGQTLFNRFHVKALLGTGGMGEVYLAWDERLEASVALKTIGRLLAPTVSIRRRFIAEVQNARRVTHPNVCRIHELFEDRDTVFFSMEYLDGRLLSDVSSQLETKNRELIVRQMAEALHAAHQTGVVHGDFKPSNVMIVPAADRRPRAVIMDFGLARALDRTVGSGEEGFSVRAGTVDYMAPELKEGALPTVRTDIFAFGKVATELLPGQRLWEECTRPAPKERPDSLAGILRRIERRGTRRSWMAVLAFAGAGAAGYAVWGPRQSRISLPQSARILVNGFRSIEGPQQATKLVRSVLLTALQQTSRFHAIADEDLLPLLRRLKPPGRLPIAGPVLDQVLKQLRASFWIDGNLRRAGARYSLEISLMSAVGQVVSTAAFHDAPNAIELGEEAGFWLRHATGESEKSIALNPAKVESYTSAVPEALERYYEAMEHYAVADMEQSAALLEEAIRLDPKFAQAHNMLGLIRNSVRHYDESFHEIELAMQLSANLPEREKISIETNYYRWTRDPRLMVEKATLRVADRPDEPRFHTVLGQTLVINGRAAEAIPSFRKAVELAPDDWMGIQRLEAALVESGQFDEALAEFQAALSRGVSNRWIYNGAGSAYMGLERYTEALQAFSNEPFNAENTADIQAVKILEGQLEIAIAAMEEQRATTQNAMEAYQANEFLCGLYFVTDRRPSAIRYLREMARLPPYPTMTENLACAASWARRLDDSETLSAVQAALSGMAARWPNARTEGARMHAAALDLWRRGAPDADTQELLLRSSGSAFSIWKLFDLAEFLTLRARWTLAEEYWEKFGQHRGIVIMDGWFPGVLVLGWLYRAIAAQGRNDRAMAHLWSRKVLDHWTRTNPLLRIVQTAERINLVSKPL